MTKHLKFGGSTADRTLHCPAWVSRSASVPKRPAGAAADTGSLIHMVMEMCLEKDLPPTEFLGAEYTTQTGEKMVFGEDHLDIAVAMWNELNTVLDQYRIETVEIEPFVEWVPNLVGGSIDVLGWTEDGKTMVVFDYKTGRMPVDVKKAQTPFYAVSAMNDSRLKDTLSGVEKIVCVITQPAVYDEPQIHEMTRAELDIFEERMWAAIENAQSKNPTAKPGEHCAFCPAAPYCAEKKGLARMALKIDPTSRAELQEAADMVDELDAWVKAVREELFLMMLRGVEIDGWKLVEKRSTRKWSDPVALMTAAKAAGVADLIVETTPMTPAKAFKVLKGHDFDPSPFVVSESSGNTIAPASDKRPPVTVEIGVRATAGDTIRKIAEMEK